MSFGWDESSDDESCREQQRVGSRASKDGVEAASALSQTSRTRVARGGRQSMELSPMPCTLAGCSPSLIQPGAAHNARAGRATSDAVQGAASGGSLSNSCGRATQPQNADRQPPRGLKRPLGKFSKTSAAKRRVRRPFSAAEEASLARGVATHGVGNWKPILDEPQLSFESYRNNTDLKDKWRNMQKPKQQPAQLRFWPLPAAAAPATEPQPSDGPVGPMTDAIALGAEAATVVGGVAELDEVDVQVEEYSSPENESASETEQDDGAGMGQPRTAVLPSGVAAAEADADATVAGVREAMVVEVGDAWPGLDEALVIVESKDLLSGLEERTPEEGNGLLVSVGEETDSGWEAFVASEGELVSGEEEEEEEAAATTAAGVVEAVAVQAVSHVEVSAVVGAVAAEAAAEMGLAMPSDGVGGLGAAIAAGEVHQPPCLRMHEEGTGEALPPRAACNPTKSYAAVSEAVVGAAAQALPSSAVGATHTAAFHTHPVPSSVRPAAGSAPLHFVRIPAAAESAKRRRLELHSPTEVEVDGWPLSSQDLVREGACTPPLEIKSPTDDDSRAASPLSVDTVEAEGHAGWREERRVHWAPGASLCSVREYEVEPSQEEEWHTEWLARFQQRSRRRRRGRGADGGRAAGEHGEAAGPEALLCEEELEEEEGDDEGECEDDAPIRGTAGGRPFPGPPISPLRSAMRQTQCLARPAVEESPCPPVTCTGFSTRHVSRWQPATARPTQQPPPSGSRKALASRGQLMGRMLRDTAVGQSSPEWLFSAW
jgi:hypothetical protein